MRCSPILSNLQIRQYIWHSLFHEQVIQRRKSTTVGAPPVGTCLLPNGNSSSSSCSSFLVFRRKLTNSKVRSLEQLILPRLSETIVQRCNLILESDSGVREIDTAFSPASHLQVTFFGPARTLRSIGDDPMDARLQYSLVLVLGLMALLRSLTDHFRRSLTAYHGISSGTAVVACLNSQSGDSVTARTVGSTYYPGDNHATYSPPSAALFPFSRTGTDTLMVLYRIHQKQLMASSPAASSTGGTPNVI
ncbi:hypothetical protein T12_7112 [Trichinella patagoniensis]|uniref:Uncharacterized protein n=1 Tax=Trichinella patagoniensis TaxID=990121 RepID=A0A0V0ZH91_9BILA|nr:hypothetical protein T12_7112 [Trichinella patagoniensis]